MRTITTQLTRTLVAAACALTCFAASAATIVITSRDAPGVGFNDPTPVAPVGGNPGTTLGQQRMNVYRYVADIWEKNLDSPVVITVNAGWEGAPTLTCTSSSATLGSAGSYNLWHDTPGTQPGTWYPAALANKLAGVNLLANEPDDGSGYGNVDIKTQFNVNLGNPGCLDGNFFYLGYDGKAGNNVNFVETLLHELGHGLGFSVLSVQTSTGNRINAAGTAYAANGLPSIWERFMYDNTANKLWLNMTSAERRASAINPQKLAWTGANAVSGAAMLTALPVMKVVSPAPTGSGNYEYYTAAFGPVLSSTASLGALANVTVQNAVTGPGCDTFNAANKAAVTGKVALIDRGVCGFVVKVKNAQDAGAIGVVIVNSATAALGNLGGADPTITIPAVMVSLADGTAIRNALPGAAAYGTRSKPGSVSATLGTDPVRKAGADLAGRPLLYTPNPLVSGSSVSHWDVSASPNLLMEPNINADLGTVLVAPKDLTVPLLKDIGW